MGLLNRKNLQTTVAIRMSLQPEMLRYAELLGTTPSGLTNDLVEGAFFAVRADQPDRAIVTVDRLRQAIGKDAHRRLSQKYYEALLGAQSSETETAIRFAHDNTALAVPLLKETKQLNLDYEAARPRVFGCVRSVLTNEVGDLYTTELMAQAAQELYDPAKISAHNYFSAMARTAELYNKVYGLFLREHLAREVVREIPPEFLPR